jgi:hypothetical protein
MAFARLLCPAVETDADTTAKQRAIARRHCLLSMIVLLRSMVAVA